MGVVKFALILSMTVELVEGAFTDGVVITEVVESVFLGVVVVGNSTRLKQKKQIKHNGQTTR